MIRFIINSRIQTEPERCHLCRFNTTIMPAADVVESTTSAQGGGRQLVWKSNKENC